MINSKWFLVLGIIKIENFKTIQIGHFRIVKIKHFKIIQRAFGIISNRTFIWELLK